MLIRRLLAGVFIVATIGTVVSGSRKLGEFRNGTYRVSSGQDVQAGEIRFEGRPADIALQPDQEILAVQTGREVFLCTPKGVLARTRTGIPKDMGAGFHGLLWTKNRQGVNWTPNGMRFVVSTDQGYLQEYLYEDSELYPKEKIWLVPEDKPRQVWPGGMCLSKDSKTLFVAVAELNAVCGIDLKTHKVTRTIPVERIPFECRLSDDEKTLIVSNWGGRTPTKEDETGLSNGMPLVINHQGSTSTGSVSIVDLASGARTDVPVGLHPSNMVVVGESVYVCNSQSDSISEIDISSKRVKRTINVAYGRQPKFGAMPTGMVYKQGRLYVCESGNNAVAVVNVESGKIEGLYPVGYFPISVELSHDGSKLYVANSKGNGSIQNTATGNPGESARLSGFDIDRRPQTKPRRRDRKSGEEQPLGHRSACRHE